MPTTMTIVFTDVSHSTQHLVEAGDADGVAEMTEHFRQSRQIVESHGGRVAKTLGDGVMALFQSASDAIGAAIALQQADEAETRSPPPSGSDPCAGRLRVGVHAGDVVEVSDDADVLGLPVVIARRLCDAAGGGQVLISDLVLQLSGSLIDVEVEPVAPLALKGIDGPTTAWSVRWLPLPERPAIRVVVAEDSVFVRRAVVQLLREEGFDVVAEVGDRDALLAAARKHRPKLVVTDVRMPPTQTDEGLTAAAVLREEDPDVAVLVLSQHVEPKAAALLLSHSPTAVAYLLKERVSQLDEFVNACRTVADGGVVIDPLVTEQLVRGGHDDEVIARLTDREREVLDYMAQGRSNAAIAEEIHCSSKTLETHIRSIFNKLDLPADQGDHRRVAAVVRWLHTRQ
jgi:DNA-binding NarL/FixJ family response regulator/class 3 adenylate cyclase